MNRRLTTAARTQALSSNALMASVPESTSQRLAPAIETALAAPGILFAAVVWIDDLPDDWQHCLFDLFHAAGIGRIYVGGYKSEMPKGLAPAALKRLDCHVLPGISFSQLVDRSRAEQPHPVLVVTEPYRLDRRFAAKAAHWLTTDPRFAAIGFWELSDAPRGIVTRFIPGAPKLASLSNRLLRRLGALRPIPVTAIHRGIAVLGRSALEVAQGLDPTYDAQPTLALAEFGFRVQRRGFQLAIEPSSIICPFRTEPSLLTTELARARLDAAYPALLEYFDSEARVATTPFNSARRVAQCIIRGLSLAICCDPECALSPFLSEFLAFAVEDDVVGTVFLVPPRRMSHNDWTRIPIHRKIVLAGSPDDIAGRSIDVAIVSASAVLPATFLAGIGRLLIEIHAGLPADSAILKRMRHSTADAVLVDNPKARTWLEDVFPEMPTDRIHSVPPGTRLTTGAPVSVEPKYWAALEWAGEPFVFCIAPGFDGRLVDAARTALDQGGHTLRMVVVDEMEGLEWTKVASAEKLTAATVIVPGLSLGEKEWCRRHAAIILDFRDQRGTNLSRGLKNARIGPFLLTEIAENCRKAKPIQPESENYLSKSELDCSIFSQIIDIFLGIVYCRQRL